MIRASVLTVILLLSFYEAFGQPETVKSPKLAQTATNPSSPSVDFTDSPSTPTPSPGLARPEQRTDSSNKNENNSWMGEELISAVIGAIVGAFFGAGASQYLSARHGRKQMKFETLRQFVANRFDLKGPEFSRVLNEIVIVYADSPQVTAALNEFAKDRNDPNLIALYRAMCKDTGVKDKNVSDESFLTAFNIKHS